MVKRFSLKTKGSNINMTYNINDNNKEFMNIVSSNHNMNIFDELLGEDIRRNISKREHIVIDFGSLTIGDHIIKGLLTLEEKQNVVNVLFMAINNKLPEKKEIKIEKITNSYSLYLQKIIYENEFDDVGFLFIDKRSAKEFLDFPYIDNIIRYILTINNGTILAEILQYEGVDGNITESRKLKSSNGISVESKEEGTLMNRKIYDGQTLEESIDAGIWSLKKMEEFNSKIRNEINKKSWWKFW